MSQKAYDLFCEAFTKACSEAGRKTTEVGLLPVSKGQSLETIKSFLSLKNFPQQLAENYLEELSSKEKALPQVEWHYQGALQSRKIEDVLKHASYIQSVSRIKELTIIQKSASQKLKGFYLQLNISSEGQKLGASEAELLELLEYIHQNGLEKHLVGLMGIASELSPNVSEAVVRGQFAYLRKFRDKHSPRLILSMGMSSDYTLAIAEGADLIRIGSMLFGERAR